QWRRVNFIHGSPMKSIVLAPLLACALATLPAFAQNSPSAANTKNTCDKPDDYPGHLASDQRLRGWQKTMETYGNCVKKYADEQRAIAESATKAGNDAVTEYNALAAKAKEAIEKSKD
ncbi:MAG: hypothetical protein ABI190_08150, partial [Casimicrobiaceae bacterium]